MKKTFFLICFAFTIVSCHLDKLTDSTSTCLNPPTASFSIEGGGTDCKAPCTVKFINSSTNATSYKLKFGDGDSTTFTSGEISHTYNSAGVFSASLIAFGDNNCPSSSITKQVTVTSVGCPNPPMALFSIQGGGQDCKAPCSVKFINNSTNATSYLLKFGDNDSITNFISGEITHEYKTAGVFTPSLTAWGNTNCPTSIYTSPQPITVIQPGTAPIAAFTFDLSNNSGFAPCNVVFTNNSIDGLSYQWNFGDNSPVSNAINPNHTYQTPGDYVVSLNVTNNFDSVTVSKTVQIKVIKFIKTFDEDGWSEDGHFVHQTNDGNYLVCGYTLQDPSSWYLTKKMLYKRIDVFGNQIWSSNGTAIVPTTASAILSTDQGYIIAGSHYNTDNGFSVSAKPNGSTFLSNSYGEGSLESMIMTPDSNYLMVGTKSGSNGKNDLFLVKTDYNGFSLWEKNFGTSETEVGYGVCNTPDGNFIAVGVLVSSSGQDVYITKLDNYGNKLWENTIGEIDQSDEGYSIIQSGDGGYIICGYGINGGNSVDLCLFKIDEQGSLLWKKYFGGGGLEIGYSVAKTSDGGFAAVGYTYSYGNGGTDAYLVKVNNNGDLLWQKTFGGLKNDRANNIKQTLDGGLIIIGSTLSGLSGTSDIYLIKTDKDGNAQ